MNFKVITCIAFCRFPGREGQDDVIREQRPCIIGTTLKATQFIAGSSHSTCLYPVFGPFHTGGTGSCCLEDGQWLPCLWLGAGATEEQVKPVLDQLEGLLPQTFTLRDITTRTPRTLKVEIRLDGAFLEILPEGYGELEAMPGEGSPVFLEYRDGKLRIVVSPDIRYGDKQIIDLEGARENRVLARADETIDYVPEGMVDHEQEDLT